MRDANGRLVVTSTTERLLLERLAELTAEVRQLRAAVGRQSLAPVSLTRNDLERLASLLPATREIFGDSQFTARELVEHPTLRVIVDGLSIMQIGRLLRRAERSVVDTYVVERHGSERNAVLWAVRELG